jgi:hypothetical protein
LKAFDEKNISSFTQTSKTSKIQKIIEDLEKEISEIVKNLRSFQKSF